MENAAATPSDYLESVEKVFLLLDEAPVTMGTLTELDDLQTRLTQEQSALALLRSRMSQSEKTFNIRNLQMFNTLLDELHRNETDYSKRLSIYDNKGRYGPKADRRPEEGHADALYLPRYRPKGPPSATSWIRFATSGGRQTA